MPASTKHAGPLCLSAFTFLLALPGSGERQIRSHSYDNPAKLRSGQTSGNVILENGPFTEAPFPP